MARDNHQKFCFPAVYFLIEFEEAAHVFTQIQNVTSTTVKDVLHLLLYLRAIEKLIILFPFLLHS